MKAKPKTTLTPEALFRYADAYARRHEQQGNDTQYPTFRQAARRFRTTLQAIADACEEYTGPGYLGAAVGFRTGLGVSKFRTRSEYEVEAYE